MSDAPFDTIAAIATASGNGGVGIIRISGSRAIPVAQYITKTKIDRLEARRLTAATITDYPTQESLDRALIVLFRAPYSFTGEDIVEIHAHGGSLILKRILAAVLSAGATMAQPGEFTLRAFLNGKIDLAQAEAIANLIAAETIVAQRAANRQLGGDLSRAVTAIADTIKIAIAHIEAAIDFPEEVGELDVEVVHQSLTTAQAGIADLLRTSIYGRRLLDGMTLVLVGAPNVGKSSLLNALAGHERAIVTPIAGTTRDLIEETLEFDGIPVRAWDTAGIRTTDDTVEKIGVERTRKAIADADMIVSVLDATREITDDEQVFLMTLTGRNAVIVVNKADIGDAVSIAKAAAEIVDISNIPIVTVSTVTKAGLGDLAQAVVRLLSGTDSTAAATQSTLVTSARHEDALRRAETALNFALESLRNDRPAELIAVDAHGAIVVLGEITGESAREDIIAGVFARFCIGK